MRFLLAVLLCLLPAAAETTAKPPLDKTRLETYLRHLFVFSPGIQIQIDDPVKSPIAGYDEVKIHLTYQQTSKDGMVYVSKDGKQVLFGNVYRMDASPFQAQLDKLKTENDPSFGTPGAPVALVLFSDFQCPLCRDEAKTLRDSLLKAFPTQVRVYFKDFPLEAIHPWAKNAAIAGRCVFRESPAAFWSYYDWIYDKQSDITLDNLKAKVLEFAGSKNLDTLQLGHCMDTRATEKEVDASLQMGRSMPGSVTSGQLLDGVDATPTLYINGRPVVGNIPWDKLKALVQFELDHQQTANDAAEKCCEVKIPSPLNK